MLTTERKAILDYLADGKPKSAMEIGSWLGISTIKASALCVALVGERKLVWTERTNIIKGVAIKVYALAR